MTRFKIRMECARCKQISWFVLEPGAKGKVYCRNCSGLLFEYAPVAGSVYILSNPSMPGTVKIGHTKISVEERARQLFTTGVPAPFVIEAYFYSGTPRRHEREIHQRLADVRLEGREHFEITAEEAFAVVYRVMRTAPARISPDLRRRIENADLLGQIKILSD